MLCLAVVMVCFSACAAGDEERNHNIKTDMNVNSTGTQSVTIEKSTEHSDEPRDRGKYYVCRGVTGKPTVELADGKLTVRVDNCNVENSEVLVGANVTTIGKPMAVKLGTYSGADF